MWIGKILNSIVRQARWILMDITTIIRSTRNKWNIIWSWHMWPIRFWNLTVMFPTWRNNINILTSVRLTWLRFTLWFVTTTRVSFTCLDLADIMGTDGEGISKSEILGIAENGNSIFLYKVFTEESPDSLWTLYKGIDSSGLPITIWVCLSHFSANIFFHFKPTLRMGTLSSMSRVSSLTLSS